MRRNSNQPFQKHRRLLDQSNIYGLMDDYFDSEHNVDAASKLMKEVIEIHRRGGFKTLQMDIKFQTYTQQDSLRVAFS